MDFKFFLIVALLLVVSSVPALDGRPTCPEPTCGGTREVASPGGDEGGEGEEEEKADPCSMDPYSAWLNHYAWQIFCEDGTIGASINPPGKIGTPAEEEAAE